MSQQGQFLALPAPHRAWGARLTEKVTGTAAGSPWVYKPEPGFLTVPKIVRAKLVTSAQVGNRQVALFVKDAQGTVIGHGQQGASQAASLTGFYCFTETAPVTGAEALEFAISYAPLPALLPGMQLEGHTKNIQTEDQWSEVTLWVEQFELLRYHDADLVRHFVEHLEAAREELTPGA